MATGDVTLTPDFPAVGDTSGGGDISGAGVTLETGNTAGFVDTA